MLEMIFFALILYTVFITGVCIIFIIALIQDKHFKFDKKKKNIPSFKEAGANLEKNESKVNINDDEEMAIYEEKARKAESLLDKTDNKGIISYSDMNSCANNESIKDYTESIRKTEEESYGIIKRKMQENNEGEEKNEEK